MGSSKKSKQSSKPETDKQLNSGTGLKSTKKHEQQQASSPSGFGVASNAAIDPLLANLFEKSAGPVQAPSVQYTEWKRRAGDDATMSGGLGVTETDDVDDAVEDEDMDDDKEGSPSNMDMVDGSEGSDVDGIGKEYHRDELEDFKDVSTRKRKRGALEDNLEGAYMEKILRDEARDVQKLRREKKAKKQKVENKEDESDGSSTNAEMSDQESDYMSPPPMHETLSGETEAKEIDKSSRTVFLGNVSNTAITSKSAKKTLLAHLSSFLSELPASNPPHKLESIRFRSTAYATKLGVPRRAAFAHKEVMDATTHSTNAYAVYSTALAAQKAPAALNATVVLGRHLRVDSVAHPSPTDHLRCVFVGNLDFVNQENEPASDEENGKKMKKQTAPADVEEGLWRTFNAHAATSGQRNSESAVESVRVIRDQATRIGKGFAYVQFYDPNGVESALLLDGKKFPPHLPRKLRVTRARKVRKPSSTVPTNRNFKGPLDGGRHTLHGRAGRLLGKAGAAKLRENDSGKPFVFEGYRATTGGRGAEGAPRLKVKSKSRGHGKGKPKNRSARRASAFRKKGGST